MPNTDSGIRIYINVHYNVALVPTFSACKYQFLDFTQSQGTQEKIDIL